MEDCVAVKKKKEDVFTVCQVYKDTRLLHVIKWWKQVARKEAGNYRKEIWKGNHRTVVPFEDRRK